MENYIETEEGLLALFTLAYEEARTSYHEAPALSDLTSSELMALKERIPSSAFKRARARLEDAASHSVAILSLLSQDYPIALRHISSPPAALFIRGNLTKALRQKPIAIVGSRVPSRDAREFSFSLASEITAAGGSVVSGLAYGCDAAAHRGALSRASIPETTPGVAVLGSGVNNVYPSDHEELAREIVDKGGAVISEFGLISPPHKRAFPARNRIISGLSIATIVIEAGEKSGSLITARLAAEQGRDVYAVPGSALSPRANGTNRLIKEGATILTSFEDLREIFPEKKVLKEKVPHKESMSPTHKYIANERDISFDDLQKALDIAPSVLLAELTKLELDGKIRCEDGIISALD